MRKSLGSKRCDISQEQINKIYRLYENFEENQQSIIFDGSDFGYRKVTIERPLRLEFQTSSERIAHLEETAAFEKPAQSNRKIKKGNCFLRTCSFQVYY